MERLDAIKSKVVLSGSELHLVKIQDKDSMDYNSITAIWFKYNL